MKLSFMTWACPEWDLNEVITGAIRYGYDGVEPRVEVKQKHGIDLAIRINDMSGRFAGVLLAGLNVKNIIREAEVGTKKYHTTEVEIVTSDGKLIYATVPHRFFEDVSDQSLFQQ